jgi:uncharacterized membrane protein YhaH (DUF805 family)
MFNYVYNNIVNNYASFEGRSSRAAFNYQILVNILIVLLFGFIAGFSMAATGMEATDKVAENISNYIVTIYGLIVLLPMLGLSIRRLHDMNLSGWFVILTLLPGVNFVYLIFLMVNRGTFGTNNYGEDPTDTPLGTIGINNPTQTTGTNVTPGSTKDILSK